MIYIRRCVIGNDKTYLAKKFIFIFLFKEVYFSLFVVSCMQLSFELC